LCPAGTFGRLCAASRMKLFVRRAVIERGRVGANAIARHRENGIAREAAEARRDDPLTAARRTRRGKAAEGKSREVTKNVSGLLFQISSSSFRLWPWNGPLNYSMHLSAIRRGWRI
jgi:hypothetical protein